MSYLLLVIGYTLNWKHYFSLAFIFGSMLYVSVGSVQFSHWVVSDSLWPHELQHARPPCPSPTPGVHPNPCPSSRWYHPTISFSLIPFSSCPQSFPASGSFQMSQLFSSGGQSVGASASTSVLPMKPQDWSPLGWAGLSVGKLVKTAFLSYIVMTLPVVKSFTCPLDFWTWIHRGILNSSWSAAIWPSSLHSWCLGHSLEYCGSGMWLTK